MKAIIGAHQHGLTIGDIVDVVPSVLHLKKGIFVVDRTGTEHYLISGYLVVDDAALTEPEIPVPQVEAAIAKAEPKEAPDA